MTMTREAALNRRSLRLAYASVGYNLLEGVVAVLAGASATSVALLGFGLDSFIEVSSALVPHFLDARLADVHGFMCSLQDGRTAYWAQRSAMISNPYFGHAWPDCGEEIPQSHP